jgi:hypothetical protein
MALKLLSAVCLPLMHNITIWKYGFGQTERLNFIKRVRVIL